MDEYDRKNEKYTMKVITNPMENLTIRITIYTKLK